MQKGIKVQQDWYPCNGPIVSSQNSRFELHLFGYPSGRLDIRPGKGRVNVPECQALKKQKTVQSPWKTVECNCTES